MPRVVVYTRRACGYCTRLLALLDDKGVAYEHHDLTFDPARRVWLARVSGSPTVPQLFIDDHPLGGYTDALALDRSGRLDELLR